MCGSVQEPVDFVFSEVFGEVAAYFGGTQGLSGVFRDDAVFRQETEEGLDGRHLAGSGGLTVAARAAEALDVLVQQVDVHVGPGTVAVAVGVALLLVKLPELGQVVAVGIGCVL